MLFVVLLSVVLLSVSVVLLSVVPLSVVLLSVVPLSIVLRTVPLESHKINVNFIIQLRNTNIHIIISYSMNCFNTCSWDYRGSH